MQTLLQHVLEVVQNLQACAGVAMALLVVFAPKAVAAAQVIAQLGLACSVVSLLMDFAEHKLTLTAELFVTSDQVQLVAAHKHLAAM